MLAIVQCPITAKALEVEADRKLQLSHREAVLDVRDLAVVAALAIHASLRPVVPAECVHGVIEDVESVSAELSCHLLRNVEPLHH